MVQLEVTNKTCFRWRQKFHITKKINKNGLEQLTVACEQNIQACKNANKSETTRIGSSIWSLKGELIKKKIIWDKNLKEITNEIK